MPFPTITEKYGSLSATGFAKEASFGVPLAATTFLPMSSNSMEEDPGWFSPTLMQGVRDKQIYNLYGEAKYTGAITGPIFPSNAMELMVASIGVDSAAGSGVTGTTTTGTNSTLASPSIVGATSITLTAGGGANFAVGEFIQIDANNSVGPTTAECRKISTIATDTLTVDSPLLFAHAAAAAVIHVVAPYTHTISEANTLPSLTVEKNLGGFQSLQFAGCRVNKFDLKAPVGNSPVEITADMIGQSATVLSTPTAINVTDEMPFVFAEASVTLYGTARTEASNVNVSVENGLKETYTYSGNHGPSFITPVTLRTSGTIDVVFDSLNDATYGDFSRMAAGTLGALAFTLTHPASGGSITINLPQIALSKYGNDVKAEDVVLSSLTYEASRPLSGTSLYTIQATVVNSVYLPY